MSLRHFKWPRIYNGRRDISRFNNKPWVPSQPVLDECQSFDLMLNNNELLRLFLSDVKKFMEQNHANDAYFMDMPRPVDKGKYLGMEIQEKTLYLSYIELDGKNLNERATKYELAEKVNLQQTNKLEEEIRNAVNKFLREQETNQAKKSDESLVMGITLSERHKSEQLWDKLALSELLRRLKTQLKDNKQRRIDVKTVVSESTASLMTGHWLDNIITSGLVLGNGPELSYMENPVISETNNVRIRCHRLDELGARGEIDYLRTQQDVTLDLNSVNPGQNRLDKLLKGDEVAEVVRMILAKLAEDGVIYAGQVTSPLMTPGSIKAKHLASVEKDPWGKQERCVKFLQSLHIEWPARQDCVDTRHVVETLTRRAAYLTAALVASLPKSHIGVALEGHLPSQLPSFIPALKHKIGRLRNHEITVVRVPRSSVIGAALIAARISSLEEPSL